MLKDILMDLKQVNSKSLFTAIGGIAFTTFLPGGGPIANPFSPWLFTLIGGVFLAALFKIIWMYLVSDLNFLLRRDGSSGVIGGIGIVLLAGCLCVTAWHASNVPDPFTVQVLASGSAIRLLAVYLLAIETIKFQIHLDRALS